METYTLSDVKQPVGISCMIRGTQTGLCNNLAGWEGVRGRREVQEGRDVCIPMADSCRCMVETNTVL